jgi:hypothetical protein
VIKPRIDRRYPLSEIAAALRDATRDGTWARLS